MLHTAKCLSFQSVSLKIVLVKNMQNQHEHTIGRVTAITRICHFLNPKPYRPLYFLLHVIPKILKFLSRPDSQKSLSEKS
jgi:hypothetical protein